MSSLTAFNTARPILLWFSWIVLMCGSLWAAFTRLLLNFMYESSTSTYAFGYDVFQIQNFGKIRCKNHQAKSYRKEHQYLYVIRFLLLLIFLWDLKVFHQPLLADPREWPRSHATFNWPIKSISFPRFAVHRTWTRSRFFIQNSSLVDNYSTEYISVTFIWMIKYVQYLIIAWISTVTSHLESFYRYN